MHIFPLFLTLSLSRYGSTIPNIPSLVSSIFFCGVFCYVSIIVNFHLLSKMIVGIFTVVLFRLCMKRSVHLCVCETCLLCIVFSSLISLSVNLDVHIYFYTWLSIFHIQLCFHSNKYAIFKHILSLIFSLHILEMVMRNTTTERNKTNMEN